MRERVCRPAQGLVAIALDGDAGAIVEIEMLDPSLRHGLIATEVADDLARTALAAHGDLFRLLMSPSPDGSGAVADYLARRSAAAGGEIRLRRAAALIQPGGAVGGYAQGGARVLVGRTAALVSVSGATSALVAEFAQGLARHIAGSSDQDPRSPGAATGDETLLCQSYLPDPRLTVAEALARAGGPNAEIAGVLCWRAGQPTWPDAPVAASRSPS